MFDRPEMKGLRIDDYFKEKQINALEKAPDNEQSEFSVNLVSTEKQVYQLDQYIATYYRTNRNFADAVGVQLDQVYTWIKLRYLVIDHVLHSPRRKFPLYWLA